MKVFITMIPNLEIYILIIISFVLSFGSKENPITRRVALLNRFDNIRSYKNSTVLTKISSSR